MTSNCTARVADEENPLESLREPLAAVLEQPSLKAVQCSSMTTPQVVLVALVAIGVWVLLVCLFTSGWTRIFLLLLSLAVLSTLLIFFFANRTLANVIRTVVQAYDKDFLGVDVWVGPVILDLCRGKVVIDEVTVENPPGFGRKPLLRAHGITFDLDVLSLIRSRLRTVEIERVDVGDVTVNLVAARGDQLVPHFNVEQVTKHMENSGLVRTWRESELLSGVARKMSSAPPPDIILHYVGWSSIRVQSSVSSKHLGEISGAAATFANFVIEDFAAECPERKARKILIFLWKSFMLSVARSRHLKLVSLASFSPTKSMKKTWKMLDSASDKVQDTLHRQSDKAQATLHRQSDKVQAKLEHAQEKLHGTVERVAMEAHAHIGNVRFHTERKDGSNRAQPDDTAKSFSSESGSHATDKVLGSKTLANLGGKVGGAIQDVRERGNDTMRHMGNKVEHAGDKLGGKVAKLGRALG